MAGRRASLRLGLPIALGATLLAAGCTIAPRSFLQNKDLAPLVRARSLGMSEGLPDAHVVPTLLEKLNDPDAVVRMTAHEELRRRTGQDFGYLPYADASERTAAVAAWNGWWQANQASFAGSSGRVDPSVGRAGYSPTPRRRGLFGRRARRIGMNGSATSLRR